MLLNVENRLWAQRVAIIGATYEKEAAQRAALFEDGAFSENPLDMLCGCASDQVQEAWDSSSGEWRLPTTPITPEMGAGDALTSFGEAWSGGGCTGWAVDLGQNLLIVDTEKRSVRFDERHLEKWMIAKPIKFFSVLSEFACKISDLFLKISFFLAKHGNLGSTEFKAVLHGISPGLPPVPDRFQQYPWNPPEYSHRPHTYFHTFLG